MAEVSFWDEPHILSNSRWFAEVIHSFLGTVLCCYGRYFLLLNGAVSQIVLICKPLIHRVIRVLWKLHKMKTIF